MKLWYVRNSVPIWILGVCVVFILTVVGVVKCSEHYGWKEGTLICFDNTGKEVYRESGMINSMNDTTVNTHLFKVGEKQYTIEGLCIQITAPVRIIEQ